MILKQLILPVTELYGQHQFRASDGASGDNHGGSVYPFFIGNGSVSLKGDVALVGAAEHDLFSQTDRGAVYMYRNISPASGNITQDLKLFARDGNIDHRFGISTAFDGKYGLVGGINANGFGTAYFFRNLDTAMGPNVPSDFRLQPSDGKSNNPASHPLGAGDWFGSSVAMSKTPQGGVMGLVGSVKATTIHTVPTAGTSQQGGAAYLFRHLDSVPLHVSMVVEDVKLMGRDVDHFSWFGNDVALSGARALVGAVMHDWGNSNSPYEFGAAYLFNNLDTISTPTVYEDAKLVFPYLDGTNSQHRFGASVALNKNGSVAAVGAIGYDMSVNDGGAAFVFNNLNVIDNVDPLGINEIFPDAVLAPSDPIAGVMWGNEVAFSGNTLIVGSMNHTGAPSSTANQGAIYFYTNTDTMNSGITNMNQSLSAQGASIYLEKAKVWHTYGNAGDRFGISVGFDNTLFFVGEGAGDGLNTDTGAGYMGDSRTFLGLDTGFTSLSTNGLSFWSRQDWVIGTTTTNNMITIDTGDSGYVERIPGIKSIVGDQIGADSNTLVVKGTLTSHDTVIGRDASFNNLFVKGTVNITAGENLIVGENISSGLNFAHVQPTGVVKATGAGSHVSVGRFGFSNTMVVDGIVNSHIVTVGENDPSIKNWLIVNAGGVVNNNNYTVVGNGTNFGNNLNVNGLFNSTGTVTISSGARLSGIGTVIGDTTVYGLHDPGNFDVGIQTMGGSVAYAANSQFKWELNSNNNALALRGIDYDGINVLGITNVSVTNPAFVLLTFDGPTSTVDWSDSFWDVSYLGTNGWLMFDMTSGTFSGHTNFVLNVSTDSLGMSLSSVRPYSQFVLYHDPVTQDVYLNYIMIPEPNITIVAFCILILLYLSRRHALKILRI